MATSVNIKVSRQKIYNILIAILYQYKTFDNLCMYISFTPFQGLRLNVKIEAYVRRTCWFKDTKEVTDCLKKDNVFEIADAIGTEAEQWLKSNGFMYEN